MCVSASNKVRKAINESDRVRPKMKPCNSPPYLGNGKLVERASMQREATESVRIAEPVVPDQSPRVLQLNLDLLLKLEQDLGSSSFQITGEQEHLLALKYNLLFCLCFLTFLNEYY